MILNNHSKTSANPAADITDEVIATALRGSGLKATPQRLAVARALSGDDTHPTAQELFDRLRASFPSMSFATVYNTLHALSAAGWLSPLSLGGATRFDPNTRPHHHAVCDDCGAVRDIPATAHEGTSTLGADFEVRSVEVTFRGLCRLCLGEGDR